MDILEFKKLFYKGAFLQTIAGIIMLSFGILTLYGVFTIPNNPDSKFMEQFGIFGVVFLAFLSLGMLAIGISRFYRIISPRYLIKKGKHKLLNAVTNNDQNYIIWLYAKEEARGKSGILDQYVYVHAIDGKCYVLDVNSREHAWEVLQYLHSKFPNASTNHDGEKSYKERVQNYKLSQKSER